MCAGGRSLVARFPVYRTGGFPVGSSIPAYSFGFPATLFSMLTPVAWDDGQSEGGSRLCVEGAAKERLVGDKRATREATRGQQGSATREGRESDKRATRERRGGGERATSERRVSDERRPKSGGRADERRGCGRESGQEATRGVCEGAARE